LGGPSDPRERQRAANQSGRRGDGPTAPNGQGYRQTSPPSRSGSYPPRPPVPASPPPGRSYPPASNSYPPANGRGGYPAGAPNGGATSLLGNGPGGGAPTGYDPGYDDADLAFGPESQRVPARGYTADPGRGRRPPNPPRGRRFIDYPRWGRDGWTRWIPSWKLVSMLFGTAIICLIIAFSYAYSSVTIPKEDQAALAQTTVVYYANGKSEIGRLATQNRQDVDLNQVPEPVRNAVLAAEDHTFYTNKGVDPTSIIRAAWADVRGDSLQGGSTISQQYVKNVYNQRDRSYKRKFTEVFLSLKINQKINKDDILDRYLNTIYLGRGAYGIQAASQAYFGQNVENLSVSQGAFLAGIINAPSLADPRGGADQKARAERRWNVVLDAMVKEGWLDENTRATEKFPTTVVPKQQTTLKGQNAYLMDMVKKEAVKDLQSQGLNVSEDSLNTGGYKIVTTFNKSMIDAGVKAVKDKLPKDASKNVRVGMASIDPSTGAVKAIYGGTDFNKEINQATEDRAQGGSTFKAFGLMSALEDGVSLDTEYNSKSPMVIQGAKVGNFGNEHFGYINLVKATQESVNTVFVQLNKDVGPPKTLAAAKTAGIPADTPDLKGNLVNVLGSANVHPIDMASAYGTFAARGVRRPYFTIQSISYVGTDKPIYTVPSAQTKGKRVFDADAVDDLTYALQHVVQGGTATYVEKLDRPVAGKTGTSNDSKSAWFVGYTPQLVTAVAFHEQKIVYKKVKGKRTAVPTIVALSPMGGVNNVTGGTFPAQIWTQFMEAALKGQKVQDFPDPSHGGDPLHTAPPSPTHTPTLTQQPTPTDTGQQQQQPTEQPTFSPQPTNSNGGNGNGQGNGQGGGQQSDPTQSDGSDQGVTPTFDPGDIAGQLQSQGQGGKGGQ
jgi:membrane peptidoglycan carboxypeptidase